LTSIESSLIQAVVSNQLGQVDSTMFTEEHRRKVWDQLRQLDLRCFEDLLSADLIHAAAERAGVRLGRGALYLANMVWLGIASAWHHTRSFSEVLTLTLRLLGDVEGFAQTHVGKEQRRAKRRKPGQSKQSSRGQDARKLVKKRSSI
jgi:hypothetical protein